MDCYIKNCSENQVDASEFEVPAWKRILDITCIIIAAPLIVPLMIVIALVIWYVSPGPVLFRQKRIGHRGQTFTIFKVRSMHVAADTKIHQEHLKHLIASGAPMVKMDSSRDSRLIPFGRPLRSSGLDELPQLINVLRGEMSLVGPRPCIPYEYEQFLPWQKERSNSLPGLTGLWQVSGKNKTTFDEMMRLDITYTQKQSIYLDCYIILKTVPVLLGQMLESRQQKKSSANSDNLPGSGLGASSRRLPVFSKPVAIKQ